jgi:hypothetical protein
MIPRIHTVRLCHRGQPSRLRLPRWPQRWRAPSSPRSRIVPTTRSERTYRCRRNAPVRRDVCRTQRVRSSPISGGLHHQLFEFEFPTGTGGDKLVGQCSHNLPEPFQYDLAATSSSRAQRLYLHPALGWRARTVDITRRPIGSPITRFLRSRLPTEIGWNRRDVAASVNRGSSTIYSVLNVPPYGVLPNN